MFAISHRSTTQSWVTEHAARWNRWAKDDTFDRSLRSDADLNAADFIHHLMHNRKHQPEF